MHRQPGFNPSYGLHALRAVSEIRNRITDMIVSIPHMGCMPYGLLQLYGGIRV